MLDATQTPVELSAVERVVAGLAERIRSDVAPGSSLLSEADMALTYAVSRLTIREAVRELAGRGLLDLGRGRRAIVREPDGAAVSDLLGAATRRDAKSFFEFMEVHQSGDSRGPSFRALRKGRSRRSINGA